jgi:hypothetical protein
MHSIIRGRPLGDRVGSFQGENVTGLVTNHDGARAIVIARHRYGHHWIEYINLYLSSIDCESAPRILRALESFIPRPVNYLESLRIIDSAVRVKRLNGLCSLALTRHFSYTLISHIRLRARTQADTHSNRHIWRHYLETTGKSCRVRTRE